jgi:hypothetical protein
MLGFAAIGASRTCSGDPPEARNLINRMDAGSDLPAFAVVPQKNPGTIWAQRGAMFIIRTRHQLFGRLLIPLLTECLESFSCGLISKKTGLLSGVQTLGTSRLSFDVRRLPGSTSRVPLSLSSLTYASARLCDFHTEGGCRRCSRSPILGQRPTNWSFWLISRKAFRFAGLS